MATDEDEAEEEDDNAKAVTAAAEGQASCSCPEGWSWNSGALYPLLLGGTLALNGMIQLMDFPAREMDLDPLGEIPAVDGRLSFRIRIPFPLLKVLLQHLERTLTPANCYATTLSRAVLMNDISQRSLHLALLHLLCAVASTNDRATTTPDAVSHNPFGHSLHNFSKHVVVVYTPTPIPQRITDISTVPVLRYSGSSAVRRVGHFGPRQLGRIPTAMDHVDYRE
ncbi:hypothetical protein CCHR01_19118 [Colletotrichum chrysophilum]|uniref:Uncharacterized protein n=1 Tax=Colletotrichum chrysophilum TaxID=1836956 RepID=A0AAD9E7H9_9PEZI|nr:hypothetical protein CCHR01_19118 [Colletotrichum chrysophilum]